MCPEFADVFFAIQVQANQCVALIGSGTDFFGRNHPVAADIQRYDFLRRRALRVLCCRSHVVDIDPLPDRFVFRVE